MENEEIKKRIENAQKFKEFLRLYPPETQARFIYAKNPDAYREIDPALKETADGFFDLREDYFTYRNAIIPQDKEPEKKEKEHKKEEDHFYYEEEHADEGTYGTTEKQTKQNQVIPRSRLEQIRQAGKTTSQRIGTDNWRIHEPIGPPPIEKTQTTIRRPSTTGSGVLGRANTAARSLRGLSASRLGSISPFGRGVSGLAKFGGKRLAVAGIGALPFIATALIIFLLLLIPIVIIGASAKDPIFAAKVGLDIFFGDHDNPSPTPVPVPTSDKPTSITFQGGEAYLTTGDGCRVNCPSVNKGDTATIKAEISLDTEQFDKDINDVRVMMQINTVFFSNIKATETPEILSAPIVNYYLYRWKLTSPKKGQNHYTFTVTGKVQSDSGETNVVLTMSGVTIINKDLGDLYAGTNSPPSSLTCNNKNYEKIMRAIENDFKVKNVNFGDPICSFKQEKLKALLEKTETNKNNVEFWMEIARCESPNSGPNGYTRDPRSWGQFQTLEGKPVFNQGNRDSIYRGDVTWQQQAINAVNLNNVQKKLNNNFEHWGSAMCLCWWPEHRDKEYCKDIVNNGARSTQGPRAPARDCPKGPNHTTCDTAVKCTNDECRP